MAMAASGGATTTLGSASGTFGRTLGASRSSPNFCPAPPRPTPPGRRGFLSRNKTVGQVVGEDCAQASAYLQVLDKAVKDMEAQIASDTKALREMDRNLETMRLEADKLARRIREEESIVDAMSPEKGLGNAMRKFGSFMEDVERSYPHFKQKHKDNINILKKEFNYHPAYKLGRSTSEFTSQYHSMHPHPNKMHK
eukprot:TRINITY_DN65112_c0_g1_i1.p1 TRINITY_DN65112_c0_g1~~TRINITY_DN65112_c0_g1_i1.p1  ORF type:complete len:229 (-),score=48.63 TRINITY_DN65112_c0_g1_i1:47-634(-)